ncbi:hypothetical protein V4F39_20725 [Aquincola sp. MAHUQ-54]|uniref:Uncharacterized protein n=1 Tax=Aquincola agrisoli TaxID=3119538 RepID=A0AAW9QLS5_9BURK
MDETDLRIGQLTSHVQAWDGGGWQDAAMLRALAGALLPLVREMLEHEGRVRRELSMHDSPLDRVTRGTS